MVFLGPLDPCFGGLGLEPTIPGKEMETKIVSFLLPLPDFLGQWGFSLGEVQILFNKTALKGNHLIGYLFWL